MFVEVEYFPATTKRMELKHWPVEAEIPSLPLPHLNFNMEPDKSDTNCLSCHFRYPACDFLSGSKGENFGGTKFKKKTQLTLHSPRVTWNLKLILLGCSCLAPFCSVSFWWVEGISTYPNNDSLERVSPDSILLCFLVYHVSYTHFQVGSSDHFWSSGRCCAGVCRRSCIG